MKPFLATLGCIAFALGIVGIFVPLLPTTPFLLLAAALWVRSSPRLYAWLLAHPRLGVYIRNFREKRAIPLRAKVVGHDALLRLRAARRLVVGAGRHGAPRRGHHVAHSLVRHAAQVTARGIPS